MNIFILCYVLHYSSHVIYLEFLEYHFFFFQDTWFYDELDLQAMDGFDEPDPDSDYDYEETYTKRRKRRGPGSKQSKPSESTSKKSKVNQLIIHKSFFYLNFSLL